VLAGVRLDGHVLDRVDGELRQEVLADLGALAGHGGRSHLPEHLLVLRIDGGRDVIEDRLRLLAGEVVAADDGRRVDVLLEQVLRLLQELAGQRDGRRRAVADFVLLGLGDLDDHLGRGVLDVHLVEDSHPVVGDGDRPEARDEHLVHAFRPERRPYGVRDRAGRPDVVFLGVAVLDPLGILAHDDHGLTLHLLAHVARQLIAILYKRLGSGAAPSSQSIVAKRPRTSRKQAVHCSIDPTCRS
jgi:hypothetical protein